MQTCSPTEQRFPVIKAGLTKVMRLPYVAEVYDNNHPGQIKSFNIDKKANGGRGAWTYDGFESQWGGADVSKGLFLMEPASAYLQPPDLSSGFSKTSKIANSNYDELVVPLEIYADPEGEIKITNESGAFIEYRSGSLTSSIPEAWPIVPISGREIPPIGYYLPDEQYSVELTSDVEATSYVSAYFSNALFNVERSGDSPGEIEHFDVNTEDQSVCVRNRDADVKTYDAQVLLQEAEREKVYVLNDLHLVAEDEVVIKRFSDDDIMLQNPSDEKTYFLELQQISLNQEVVVRYGRISLEGNASHTLLADWDNLEQNTLEIHVDNGMDGTVDEVLEFEPTPVSVVNQHTLPSTFSLSQNYPNPFNPSTTINFSLPTAEHAELEVFDILGRKVATLAEGMKTAGKHAVTFDASRLPSGVYVYQLRAGHFTETKRMLLLK